MRVGCLVQMWTQQGVKTCKSWKSWGRTLLSHKVQFGHTIYELSCGSQQLYSIKPSLKSNI